MQWYAGSLQLLSPVCRISQSEEIKGILLSSKLNIRDKLSELYTTSVNIVNLSRTNALGRSRDLLPWKKGSQSSQVIHLF
jgi:hypothetical protein